VPAELRPDHLMAAGTLTPAELPARDLGHKRLLVAACPTSHAAATPGRFPVAGRAAWRDQREPASPRAVPPPAGPGRAPGCRPVGSAGVLRAGPAPRPLCGRVGLVTQLAESESGRDSAAVGEPRTSHPVARDDQKASEPQHRASIPARAQPRRTSAFPGRAIAGPRRNLPYLMPSGDGKCRVWVLGPRRWSGPRHATRFWCRRSADDLDVFRLRSLLALGDVELDFLPLLQAAVATAG